MKRVYYLIIFLISVMSCKKPYNPSIIAKPTNYLVVEGVINTGADSTVVRLSRTVNLSQSVTLSAETGAIVAVESDAGGSFPLTEIRTGYYVAVGLNLDNSKKYRLRIRDNFNQRSQEYLSDFETVTATPPIDSVGYTVQSKGMQVYVNTHDPKNSTHYYRWDYQETWLFHAKFGSEYVTNGSAIVPRAKQIFTCFGNSVSNTIVLGSSAKLSQDVIYQNPITDIVSTSEKLEAKYSILVKQYALSFDAYTFWTTLKKNTEQLGSIFDGEPSNINGNIHNTNDPAEPVIGYISACNVQTKRIFIRSEQLPSTWIATYPYACQQDTNLFCHYKICENDVAINLIPLGSASIPTTALTSGLTILGYLSSDAQCVDCTLRGTTVQPAFWK